MKQGISPHIAARYRHISNLVRSQTRADAKDKAITLSNCFRTAVKKFWQWVNSVKHFRASLPSLLDGDSFIKSDSAKADFLIDTFIQFLLRKIENPTNYHPSFNLSMSPLKMFFKNYHN